MSTEQQRREADLAEQRRILAIIRAKRNIEDLASEAWHIDGHTATACFDEEGRAIWSITCPDTPGRQCVMHEENTEPRPTEPDHPVDECPEATKPLTCPHWEAFEEAEEDYEEWVPKPERGCWLVFHLAEFDASDTFSTDVYPYLIPLRPDLLLAWRQDGYGEEAMATLVPADAVRAARGAEPALLKHGRLSLRDGVPPGMWMRVGEQS